MTENPEPSQIDDEYEANVSLTYDYIEKSIQEVQDISDNINNKFLLLATFNLTCIRFFLSGLPELHNYINSLPCNSCLLLKILAYIFSACSIVFCFVGLYSNIEYFIIPSNLLINECDRSSNTGLRLAIINTRNTKLERFIQLAKHKKKIFNYSIIFCLLSGLISIMDEIINFVFY